MQNVNLDEMLRNAVRVDEQNHMQARKGHVDPWIPLETLGLLKTYPNELTDEWIQEAIEKRKKMIKQSAPLDHYLELELIALNSLKRHIHQSFPNSFPIDRELK